MTNQDYYKEKICIVTGANSGIGYALSEELLKRGATVYLLGRDPGKVAAAAKKLSSHGDRVRTLVADVTDGAQVQRAIEGAAAEAGRLDMLFNNAGIGGTMQFEKATLDDWKKLIDTNIWSVIYGVHAALPIMLRQGSGHVVNTSSAAGIFPPPFQALYSLSKFGVTGMTECLRYEFAEKGLAFSTVCPSNIATPIFQKSPDGTVHDQLPIPDDAYPADRTAVEILDAAAERKGVIVVPEQPGTDIWRGWAAGDPGTEAFLMQMAHDRRVAYETKGSYF
ncbi:MAG: SDR family oxidoreductase [Methanospirillum sp.]|nr:SDR family oxidoreductase [Methanospirillum sp.]